MAQGSQKQPRGIMISHRHKCIFIHIPKCAGTSIEEALGHLDGHTGRGGQDHRSIRHLQPLQTNRFSLSNDNIYEIAKRLKRQYFKSELNHRNKYTVTDTQYDSYFKFTFIRNPWARAFSWYKAVMRDEITKKGLRITGNPSLEEALKTHAGKGLLKPQPYWIKDFTGTIHLDYIGRFETLEDDFEEVRKKANLPEIKLPHRLKGLGGEYRKHYTETAKKIIAKIYEEEIALFKYTF
ncbi:MAG: sulfotransferase family 2 domain-containing protein [Gammaproteobacteria bacterium]|nr:sulfotransferase family 2 domain-containing protein [Gammaproteobacteria bacterium]